MGVSRARQIAELEDKARMLQQQIAWADGERKFWLREQLSEVEAHIRFLKCEDDPNPEQMRLF